MLNIASYEKNHLIQGVTTVMLSTSVSTLSKMERDVSTDSIVCRQDCLRMLLSSESIILYKTAFNI